MSARSHSRLQSLTVNDDSFIAAVCLVEETVWLAELTGLIRVYWFALSALLEKSGCFSAKTYAELYCFAIAPHLLPLSSEKVERLSIRVAEMAVLKRVRRVCVAVGSPGVVLLCRPPSEVLPLVQQQSAVEHVVSAVRTAGDVHCVTAVSVQDSR